MRRKFIRVSCALLVCLCWFASIASAQLFGSDDKKSERILLEIKKLNTRIVEKVIPQVQNTNRAIEKMKVELKEVQAELNRMKSANNSVSQQMDILSNVIPSMQGSIEQNHVQTLQEIKSLGKDLTQLETQIKFEKEDRTKQQKESLAEVKQEISVHFKSLKEGMAKDMERMAQLNQEDIQALIQSNEKRIKGQNERVDKSIAVMTEIAKGGSKTSTELSSLEARVVENSKSLGDQNKKIIDILSKALMAQENASTKIDALGGNQSKSDENLKFTRETMVALKGILDKRLVEIDKTQQTLQTQNEKNLQNVDLIKQNLLVADQKINKLAKVLKDMQNQQSQSGEIGRTKADLINEKITRLIEILKTIASEQGKMERLMASKGGKGDDKKLMDALTDLKRKANVIISRNDSILKKLK